jgi:serine/threonine protein kinase
VADTLTNEKYIRKTSKCDTEEKVLRATNETALLASMNHCEYLPKFHESLKEEKDGVTYVSIYMEYVQGRTLEAYFTNKQLPICIKDAMQYFLPCVMALCCLHEAHIVHRYVLHLHFNKPQRDLHPGNVIVLEEAKGLWKLKISAYIYICLVSICNYCS